MAAARNPLLYSGTGLKFWGAKKGRRQFELAFESKIHYPLSMEIITRAVPIFSRHEFEDRMERVSRLMVQERFDALLCYASRIFPGSVRYLTGYETRLGIHDAVYFLITIKPVQTFTLFSNASWEHASEQTWVEEVVITSSFGVEISGRLNRTIRRLGVVGYNYLPVPIYLSVRDRFPEMELLDATEAMMRLRAIKSSAEIELLRCCAEITDRGGEAFLRMAQPGLSERELAAEVEYAMKTAGGEEVSFTTQVGTGERTADVVVYPGDRVLHRGDPIQLDCGTSLAGYRGDLSRATVVASRPEGAYLDMLEVVAEMYDRCVEAVRPEVPVCQVARVGIQVAEAHGLEKFLYRSPNHEEGFMGHGIGCHYSEWPEIVPEGGTSLEENMVVVIEPILMRPGVGGVKIEDAVLVTASGYERFSSCEVRPWRSGASD